MSVWNLNEKKRKYIELDKDISTDILIIGGGLTGLNTAYYLQSMENICVVDANIIGHVVTLNSTAKINYFQQRIYTDIEKATNFESASKYLYSQLEAIENLVKIIKSEKIDCDLKKVPSYVFANSKSEISKLNKEVLFLRKNGCIVEEKELPDDTISYKSYYVKDTYTFNPIKYLNAIYKILKDKNINIYEKTKIVGIEKIDDGYICYTENNKIKAKKVILACHYPFFLFPMIMPLRCSIEKSYMIVSKVEKEGKYTSISSNYPVYSKRFYNDGKNIYQISLAKSNDLSKTQDDKYFFDRVKKIFKLKDEDIVMKYTNCDIMTPDSMPYIGRIKDNLYIGVGYNTWGMTNSILAAKIIANLIFGVDSEYGNLFNPNRFNKANIFKLPKYIYNNAKTFIGTKINKNKPWYSNKVSFFKINGESLGKYIDEDGKEHIVYNKCPHLGCSLLFNEVEKTWDCPCHSSRYDIDGHCIKGPSNYDISYKED